LKKNLAGENDITASAHEVADIGDLILVRVEEIAEGYCTLENIYGRSEKLYKNDCFVGVLGNRYSC
jgi:hypothetical protein